MFSTLVVFSAVSFLFFGIGCLASRRMAREFQRYGLARYRKATGLLQLAGTGGLTLGFVEPICGLVAAGGLALQMLLGVGVRLRIRDSLLQTSPAILYSVLNAYLFVLFWERI